MGLGLGLGLVFLKHVLTCAQLKLLYREYQTMVPCSRIMFVLKIQIFTHLWLGVVLGHGIVITISWLGLGPD